MDIQLRVDNYDIKHNPKVREKYPNLYNEVKSHDEVSFSSWYRLSDAAYREYLTYMTDDKIGYIN